MGKMATAVLTRGPAVIGGYFGWMNKFAKHPEKYALELRYGKTRKLVRSVALKLRSDFILQGEENLPEGVYLLVSNHLTTADALTYISVFDKPISYVAKAEAIKLPFVGKVILGIDGLPMVREDLKQSLRVMMKVEADLKAGNRRWIIFPEGTRNKDPLMKMREFHHGTFRCAMKAGVPIVPVATYGSQRMLPISCQYKKLPIFVNFLKPIMPSDYQGKTTQEVAKMAEDAVQRAITFDLRLKDHAYMSALSSKYRFNHNK